MSNREEWLQRGVASLREWFKEKADVVVPEVAISVGFPKGGGGRGKTIGQCWKRADAQDSLNHIFVHPELFEAHRVLAVTVHELVHAVIDPQPGHGKTFSTLAKKVGLLKPWARTIPGTELQDWIKEESVKLGPYPHGSLTPAEKKRPGSRLRLWQCSCTGPGAKARVASDDWDTTCNKCGKKFSKDAKEAKVELPSLLHPKPKED